MIEKMEKRKVRKRVGTFSIDDEIDESTFYIWGSIVKDAITLTSHVKVEINIDEKYQGFVHGLVKKMRDDGYKLSSTFMSSRYKSYYKLNIYADTVDDMNDIIEKLNGYKYTHRTKCKFEIKKDAKLIYDAKLLDVL